MRFLHTADLHIGKNMKEIPLWPDQKYILDEIVDIAVREKADAVLIAGDVYQKSAPQEEAMELFDRFVTELSGRGIKVFAVSGNHDSAQRVSYFSGLIRDKGVYVTEKFAGGLQMTELNDGYGTLRVYMLPYIRGNRVKKFFADREIASTNDAVAAILETAGIDSGVRNVFVGHQFILNAEKAGSEDELTVGTAEAVLGDMFSMFDYAAFGHIHSPQKIGRETVRYAGSPLKYSVAECRDNKSVVIADVKEKGRVDVKLVPLGHLHDVRHLEGKLDEIRAMPESTDYVDVTLTDEEREPGAVSMLRDVFPNLIAHRYHNSRTKETLDVDVKINPVGLDPRTLFREFYRLQNNDQEPGEMCLELFDRIFRETEVN